MDLKNRLTSRKFWLALASFAVFALNGQWDEAQVIVMTYLGVEGATDVVASREQAKTQRLETELSDDEPDTTTVISGDQLQ